MLRIIKQIFHDSTCDDDDNPVDIELNRAILREMNQTVQQYESDARLSTDPVVGYIRGRQRSTRALPIDRRRPGSSHA